MQHLKFMRHSRRPGQRDLAPSTEPRNGAHAPAKMSSGMPTLPLRPVAKSPTRSVQRIATSAILNADVKPQRSEVATAGPVRQTAHGLRVEDRLIGDRFGGFGDLSGEYAASHANQTPGLPKAGLGHRSITSTAVYTGWRRIGSRTSGGTDAGLLRAIPHP
jgi:hypothetical protein